MGDISGFGVSARIVASRTFPVGFTVTEFADDADPIDAPSIQVNDKSMGLNGDLITWSKASPLNVTINVIPGSESDKNLAILLEANRVGKGKTSARDKITMVVSYPDDTSTTYVKGAITDGVPSKNVASAGRLKTNSYAFSFENKVSV